MFHSKSVAGNSPFQHLASRLNLTTAKKAEDDEDKKKDDPKAEDKDDDKKDKDDDKKSKKAKNEDDERGDEDEKMSAEKDEGDGGDDDDETKKKSKKKSKAKAKADDGDQEKDDEPQSSAGAFALGRSFERKRISDILRSPEANSSSAAFYMAFKLAIQGEMAAEDVKTICDGMDAMTAPAPKDNSRREALEQRMAKSPKPDIGVDGEGGPEATFAQKVILAGKRRRGEI